MKIIVTGSLGHIGKPLTKELVQKGHTVTVISSKPEKQKDIQALGATAAIGSIEGILGDLPASEIAYELGFEHPQSFSKLFKNKMKVTPLEYRQSFN